jgi:hypothetical protein
VTVIAYFNGYSGRTLHICGVAGGSNPAIFSDQFSNRSLKFRLDGCALTRRKYPPALRIGVFETATGPPPTKGRHEFAPNSAGGSVPEGKILGLQMCFQLPTSGYATMLIRELLKETTATTQHRDRTLADQRSAERVTEADEILSAAQCV